MLEWSVTYKNGEVHKHSTLDFKTTHIDPKQLDIITLKDPNALIPTFILHFDDKRKRPIFHMRRQLPSGVTPFETRCHLVGWQMNVKGENIQVVNYVFETIGRKIMIDDPANLGKRIQVIHEMVWIESAGKFDRARDSWFKHPSEKQLAVVGSTVKETN